MWTYAWQGARVNHVVCKMKWLQWSLIFRLMTRHKSRGSMLPNETPASIKSFHAKLITMQR